MKNNETKDFIAYEYLSLNIKEENTPMYIDCYENYGWDLINNESNSNKDYYINHSQSERSIVNIKFKRDRNIKNKIELNNLQRKMEGSLQNIESLKKESTTSAMIASLIIGTIGTVFMALSVFAVTAENPLIVPCIIFGALGFIGWILPYFAYKKIKNKKEQKNTTLIEDQYNIIYDTCEKASKLSR